MKTLTVAVSDHLYASLTAASRRTKRPINDIVVETISAIAPVTAREEGALRQSLAEMALLNDAALWRAARATMTDGQRERMAAIHEMAQESGLTLSEQTEEDALLRLYRETLLVRAQAAVLLANRGYDVADPTQFPW